MFSVEKKNISFNYPQYPLLSETVPFYLISTPELVLDGHMEEILKLLSSIVYIKIITLSTSKCFSVGKVQSTV